MIPSLLQIPSAVSDSKLHSVLPNNGKGDFTFDRSTGATRINRDGLIEEVGYFSSELVQNGDFSELGSELIVNGDFATDSDWTKQTGWTIANGKATCDGTDLAQLYQSNVLTLLKTYKVTFSIVSRTSGGVFIKLGANMLGTTRTEVGTYTEYFLFNSANPSNLTVHLRSSNFVGSIDNVSVKQVDPNDRWTLVTGWAYGSNKLTGSATTGETEQDVNLPSGKVYKATFTIEDYVSGDVRIRFRGGTTVNGTNRSGNGTYTEILTSTGHTNVKIDGGTSFTGSVSNISVVEVQGDRPRLSYDITNGVVEDKPHLLLEPSSTNLVLFSEDFSNSSWTNIGLAVDNVNLVTSPDGTKNAQKITAEAGGFRLIRPAASIGGTSQTFSIFVKNVNASNFYLRTSVGFSYYNFASKTTTGGNITATEFGNGWIRLSVRPPHNAYKQFGIGTDESTGGTAEVGNSVYVWGMQVEAGSIATSYIPTAGTTITRAAETCNNSKPSVNSTEGVLYAEIAANALTSTLEEVSLSDGTTSNRITFRYYDTSDNRIQYRFTVGGSDQSAAIITLTDATAFNKIALSYQANSFLLYVNGSKVNTDTSGSVPSAGTFTTLNFDRADGANDFYGKVKGLAVYNEALSESQLMQLTGVTASSIYNNFVTRTASFTVEALNEVKKVIDNL